VTGANRGIGFEICRQLAGRGVRVVLTSRSKSAAEEAVLRIAAPEGQVRPHQLDVTQDDQVQRLARFLDTTFGQIDVLVNNAGILADADGAGVKVDPVTVRATLETNAIAPLLMVQVLCPLLQRSEGGRVVNISSGMGALSEMEGGYAAYRISKTALNAVTAILAAELRGSVAVNSMCPGWVRTDMGGHNAERDVAEGADTAVWLALDAPQTLTGKFIRDRKVIQW
jgi:NAD(P)-dependent dehydrogenase (short-subunit alcohol dehydrogenase family)